MYDGNKAAAEKIIYDTLDKIKDKTKTDPMKIFNDAINNIRPNLEVVSRRVGGAHIKFQLKWEQKDHIRWR